MVEAMLSQLEMQQGLKNRIGIEALIETALGMANVEDIARNGAGRRLEALHFGVADYAASNRARTTNIGGLNPDYPGDQWHAAISRMTVACRAYGLRPIDGPFGDIKETLGGYVIVKADSVDEAVEFAKGSPVLQGDGNTVEVRLIATGDGIH